LTSLPYSAGVVAEPLVESEPTFGDRAAGPSEVMLERVQDFSLAHEGFFLFGKRSFLYFHHRKIIVPFNLLYDSDADMFEDFQVSGREFHNVRY